MGGSRKTLKSRPEKLKLKTMLTPEQKNKLQAKMKNFSSELDKLAENPIQENEAGQIEGGFAESATEDSAADDIIINFFC